MTGEQETGRPDRPEDTPEATVEGGLGEPQSVADGQDSAASAQAPEAAAGTGEEAESPEQLTALLEDARAKADEHWDQVLRARAELENLRRRHSMELEKTHKYALDSFVKELLQVRDSLELGRDAASEGAADIGKLREGTELTLKLLTDVMSKFGVEQIDPQGETFDPQHHQAMTMQPRADVPPNTVVSVVQKGYLLNGRLVRPAMVIVSSAA